MLVPQRGHDTAAWAFSFATIVSRPHFGQRRANVLPTVRETIQVKNGFMIFSWLKDNDGKTEIKQQREEVGARYQPKFGVATYNVWIVSVIDCMLTLSSNPQTSVSKKASQAFLFIDHVKVNAEGQGLNKALVLI